MVRRWEDDGVLVRALTVCDAFNRRKRVDSAFLVLWFAGYEMDFEKVRVAWLSSLNRTKAKWLKNASSEEECEDALGSLFTPRAKRELLGRAWVREAGLTWKQFEPLLLAVLNACFNTSLEIAFDDIDERMADAVRAFMYRNAKTLDESARVTKADLERILAFVHKNLSLDARQRLILSATDEELSAAHRRWRSAIQILDSLFARVCNGEKRVEIKQTMRQLAACFLGAQCIFALLYLERDGKGPWVDSLLERIARESHNISLGPGGLVNARLPARLF